MQTAGRQTWAPFLPIANDPSVSVEGVRRVLMTADAVGGVWTFCLELSAYLARRKVDVVLATMGPRPTQAQRRAVRSLGRVTLVENDSALEWMPEPWADVDRAATWLKDIETAFKPHVVHLNQYSHGALAWRCPVIMTAHSCVLSWWRAVKQESPPASWNTYATRVREGLMAADVVTAPTRAILEEVQRCYGRLRRTRVIYNGRSAETFFPGAKRDLILSVGRMWDEAKNLEAVDRAALDLPWSVVVVGPTRGPHGQVATLANARSLGTLGSEEVADCLAEATIFCSPALYEPFGISALEAAMSGCVLVLSNIATFREVWGDAALYVDPRDAEDLRQTLLRLIESASLRTELAQAARERARQFAGEAWAQSYLDVYQCALEQESPAKEGQP